MHTHTHTHLLYKQSRDSNSNHALNVCINFPFILGPLVQVIEILLQHMSLNTTTVVPVQWSIFREKPEIEFTALTNFCKLASCHIHKHTLINNFWICLQGFAKHFWPLPNLWVQLQQTWANVCKARKTNICTDNDLFRFSDKIMLCFLWWVDGLLFGDYSLKSIVNISIFMV